jgi:hypothetical protein
VRRLAVGEAAGGGRARLGTAGQRLVGGWWLVGVGQRGQGEAAGRRWWLVGGGRAQHRAAAGRGGRQLVGAAGRRLAAERARPGKVAMAGGAAAAGRGGWRPLASASGSSKCVRERVSARE